MEPTTAQISPNGAAADADLIDVPGYGARGRSEWLDIDWRQYRQTTSIEGRDVNYVEMGDLDAPPVVLIHGLAGCWQNWLENIPVLARDFHVIAPDLPGFGLSPLPAETISLPSYARTIAGLLDNLEIDRAHLIGNSMGGQTSVQTAIDFPDRTARVILVSPAGLSTSSTPQSLGALAGIGGFLLPRLARGRKTYARRPGLRKIALDIVAAHPEKLRPEMAYELMGGDRKIGFAAAAQAVISHDFRDRLVEIGHPTLIVWGRNDRIITSRDAARFAAGIKGSKKLVLRDTGHVAMIEHPEWFNNTARDFLLAD
ncbi:MAG: alpha/beta fold hydrolase [Actinobacteria bacterium]|nr:alpha/beta fold hydrolase [Actinomycetota bacterium]